MWKSSTDIDNFVDNWTNGDKSAFDNFSDNFFQNVENYSQNSKQNLSNAILQKEYVKNAKNHEFFARISVLNQDELTLL